MKKPNNDTHRTHSCIYKICNKKESVRIMNKTMSAFEVYGRKLEGNDIVTVDCNGVLIESHSGLHLARNGKELDLLIAWMETLRKQMPE
ncbi:hypothetical protein [Klebsiella aerogenes]|uniref:hypothetical protein n=1 Tax=Klebsiella aerogenes TaxID=548 RepID=UPI0032DBAC60